MATEHLVNAQPHSAPQELAAHAAAAAASVWVSQAASGPPVAQVKQSGPGSNNLYWMNLSNSTVAHTIDFVVTFKAGSPLNYQRQHFSFPGAGYGGGVTTPFGVPYWGGNPILGPAVLTVLVNGVSVGHYNFTIVP